jgi:uncharacterized damage-inducible protein DinB
MTKAMTLFPYDAMWREVGCAYRALEDVRADLKGALTGLSPDLLDRDPGQGAPTIGALVCHIGMAEAWYVGKIWRKEPIAEAWKRVFDAGLLDKNPLASRGLPLVESLATLDAIREQTRLALMKTTDAEMDRATIETKRGPATLRWMLHHLVEHEAHHRGQIALLRRLFGAPRGGGVE